MDSKFEESWIAWRRVDMGNCKTTTKEAKEGKKWEEKGRKREKKEGGREVCMDLVTDGLLLRTPPGIVILFLGWLLAAQQAVRIRVCV